MGNPFYPAYDPDRGRWSDDRLALTEPMVLVDAFKAASDTTDGPAFRRASAAVAAGTCSPTIRLGARTYMLDLATMSSGAKVAVPMTKGVRWVGPGRGLCTVKMTDGVGDYRAIFGPAALTDDLSGARWEGFTLTSNAAGNDLGDNADRLFVTQGDDIAARRCIQVRAGRGVVVKDVHFNDVQAIWAIDAAGPSLYDVTVKECRFDVGHPTLDYDHTTVYYHAGGTCRLVDCDFYSTSGKAGRQAFELHGGRHTARGNNVYGYPNPWCATGSVYHGAMHGDVEGNGFYGAAAGADLWSQYGTAGQYGIDGLVYRGNIVELDHARWAGSRLVAGFSMNGGSDLPVRGLLVEGNEFRTTTWGTFAALDVSSAAFNITRYSSTPMKPQAGYGAATDVDLIFRGNIIDGMAGGGLRYRNSNGAVDGLVHERNRYRDIARAGSTVFDSSNQALAYLNAPSVARFESLGNRVYDSSSPRRLTYGTLLYQVTTQGAGRDDGAWVQTCDGASLTDGRPAAWKV